MQQIKALMIKMQKSIKMIQQFQNKIQQSRALKINTAMQKAQQQC